MQIDGCWNFRDASSCRYAFFVALFLTAIDGLRFTTELRADAPSVADKSDTVRDFHNETAFFSQNAVLSNKLRTPIGNLCRADLNISPQNAAGVRPRDLCFPAEYNERVNY